MNNDWNLKYDESARARVEVADFLQTEFRLKTNYNIQIFQNSNIIHYYKKNS